MKRSEGFPRLRGSGKRSVVWVLEGIEDGTVP